VRLFVALTLPRGEQLRIHEALAPLREAGLPVRWIRPESIHLTLKFLGESPPAVVPEIEAALAVAAARTRPFELMLGGFGAFPSLRNPRVLWLAAEASPPLRLLKQDLEWELSPLGFPREVRAFQPHLTLGRTLPQARAGDFRDLDELLRPLDLRTTIPVDEIDLMRSQLSPGGAVYERIATRPLG
jgi:2'-5' RNA ligase